MLLSHTHPVSKLSEDGCYSLFKKNSREAIKVHPTGGECPLGSMLNSKHTLLPSRYAAKVTSELIPKCFLQSDHADEVVGNFYWPKIILSDITFVPSCHASLLLHLFLEVTLSAEVTFKLKVTMKLEP